MDYMIVGLGEKNDPQRLALQTIGRWDIPNAPRRRRSPAEMIEAHRIHRGNHPSLVLRSQRSDYDCVGLVFGSRRTMIDIDHIRRILQDDGYVRIPDGNGQRGDFVLYEDATGPAHIGILWHYDPVFKTRTVLSQWGSDGEYFHLIDDVREDWKREISIWTERVIFS
jgi:hypothetical protein